MSYSITVVVGKMSHMNLYIKKEGVLRRATVPVFVPKGLLLRSLNEEELQTIFRRAVADDNIVPYDLGVFVIDADKKAIVSAQMAFALEDLENAVNKKLTQGWKYVELEAEAATPQLILETLQQSSFPRQ